MPHSRLDLRTTKCPLNFVKAKLALEKLSIGSVIELWLQPGSESILNIPNSLQQEGHLVVCLPADANKDYQCIQVTRCV